MTFCATAIFSNLLLKLLTNYKLLQNGLPTNEKFKNRYGNKCFLCNKVINESLEHIFVTCEIKKKNYEYLKKKFILSNSLDLLKFKRGVTEDDYRVLSVFVYVVGRIRNYCKHGDNNVDLMETFKVLFKKCHSGLIIS